MLWKWIDLRSINDFQTSLKVNNTEEASFRKFSSTKYSIRSHSIRRCTFLEEEEEEEEVEKYLGTNWNTCHLRNSLANSLGRINRGVGKVD